MFEKALKLKFRYKVANGIISTEDLWDLTLEQLDSLAKSLNKSIKESAEESFISKKSDANTTLEAKFEIVKHVIKYKLDLIESAKLSKEKREKKMKLMELISNKENEILGSKSIEELKAEFAKLDD